MALNTQERQVLLAELTELAAELDALQQRTDQLIEQVTRRSSIRLAQPA